MLFRKWVVLYSGKHTAQVLVEILHYNKNIIKMPVSILRLLGWNHNIQQLGRKKVIFHHREQTENCDFSDDFPALVTIPKNVWNLFNGYELSCLHAAGFYHLPETASPNIGEQLIFWDNSFPDTTELYLLHLIR